MGLALLADAHAQSPGAAVVQAAQIPARIAQPIDNRFRVRVMNSTHPLAVPANDRGRVDGNLPMERILLLLKPSSSQQGALNRLIASQHDPASSNYQHWLSPEQYAASFGLAPSDLSRVTGWLSESGFRVSKVARGGQWVEFSGSAAQVENAFQTEIHNYLVHGEKHIANSTDISLPQALTSVVTGVLSLHDFRKQPLLRRAFPVQRDPVSGTLKPVPGAGTPEFTAPDGVTHFLTPGDWARIYNTEPLLKQGINGSDITIAIVGADSDVQLSDIRTFRKIFKLPAKDPLVVINGTDPGVLPFSSPEVEADLDIEWAGAIAPQANITFVTSSTTASTDGFDLSLAHIVDNRLAPIMSVSIGACEMFLGTGGNAFLYSAYQQAAAEGISVISAAGDTGPAGCDPQVSDYPAQLGAHVNGSASTPFNVAVGGTEFTESGQDSTYWLANNRPDLSSAIGYIPEAVWNESCDPTVDPSHCANSGFPYSYVLDAGSGGASNCSTSTITVNPDGSFTYTCLGGYAKPSWQAGLGVPDDSARDIPDLSFTASGGHDGYFICVEGICQSTTVNGQTELLGAFVVGGTSAGAPTFAGVTALLEQKVHAYQGLLNFNLYKLAAGEDVSTCNSSNITDPHQRGTCVFYDTTAGNNNVPGLAGADASPGFDLATGLGSLNVAQFVDRWLSARKLHSNTRLSVREDGVVLHGQPLAIHVNVRPDHGGGAPSGDFSLQTDTSGSVFGGTLTNGAFSGNIANLPGGDYRVRAHYPGDPMFNSSDSEPVHVRIAPEDAIVAVSVWDVSPDGVAIPLVGTVGYGQNVGLQIDVQGKSGMGAPSGSIFIRMDDSTNLGPYALNQAGNAFVWIDGVGASGLQPGTHTFRVSYAGDRSFNAAVAAPVSFKVTRDGAIQIVLFPVQYPWTAGVPIDLVAAIGPFGEPVPLPLGKLLPSGTVQIYDCNGDGNNAVCNPVGPPLPLASDGPLGPGLAQAAYRAELRKGTHSLRASYAGDGNYEPISPNNSLRSRPFDLTVTPPANVAVRFKQRTGTIGLGQSDTYSILVEPKVPGSPAPTGTITLFDVFFNQLGNPASLVNGTANISVPWYQAGAQSLFANYSGDNNYVGISTPTLVTVVEPGLAKVRLTSVADFVKFNSQTTLTTLVGGSPSNPNILTPGDEFGQVEYFDSVDGSAPRPLGAGPQLLTVGNGDTSTNVLPVVLPVGRNVISAKFLGTADWDPAESNSIVVLVDHDHHESAALDQR